MAYEPQAEYTPQGDWGGIVTYGNDKHLVVMFYMRSVPNALKSAQAGARFHDMIPYVKIHHPGEQDQVIDRPVNENDKFRFRARWREFMENRTQLSDGIPIDMLFPTRPDVCDNLRSYGVHTVEQCANMSAHAIDNIGLGAQEYKNRAHDYMEAASAGANYHKFTHQLEGLTLENTRLKAELASLSAKFDAIMTQVQRGLPVPGAMVPQTGYPGAPQSTGSGPSRGDDLPALEPAPAAEVRHDLMAEIPKVGKIPKKPWGKKVGDDVLEE